MILCFYYIVVVWMLSFMLRVFAMVYDYGPVLFD